MSDFAQHTVSEFVAGLGVVAVTGGLAVYRLMQARLNRHANEIRHTQDKTNVEPFYPEYPADKL